MEINDALLQLCKSNDFVNIELAYITSVESGMMSFMEFLMLLFLVREDNRANKYCIELSVANHYTLVAKRLNYDILRFSLNIEFTDNGKTGTLYYHKSGNHKVFKNNVGNIGYTIHKVSLLKTVDSIFKPECLVGHKKGVIKFISFLNILTQLEKQIDIIHEDFKIWLGYGNKV